MSTVGDFNGDGFADVALNLPGTSSVAIFYGRGDGTFYEGTELQPVDYPAAIAAGDFNGNGKSDVIVGLTLSHEACLFSGTSQDVYTRSCFATGALTDNMIATDLNHDGKPDLAITNFLYDFVPPNADVVFHK